MAKRKKHTKLPNGYGSICYLGKGRRRPYGVYPPVTQFTLSGVAVRPKAIGYAEDWYQAYDLLIAWKNGRPLPGSSLVQQEKPLTFSDVYNRYYTEKYDSNTAKKLSEASRNSAHAAFKNCKALHDREFASLRYEDLQAVVDGCTLKHSSIELIVTLLHQMYKYAEKYELAEKDYSKYLEIRVPEDDEHGVPFSEEEIRSLWNHKADETAQMLLVMIYSGYRMAAYKSLKIDLNEWYFQGGVKTAASKNRIVPIHSGIKQIVADRIKLYGKLLPVSDQVFRKQMAAYLPSVGITSHTPHDCRHTFSQLCESFGVRENDRKRLLGHTFTDITNKIYGHRNLDELRSEIEKIRIPG